MVLQGFGIGPDTVGVVILIVLCKLLQTPACHVRETDKRTHRQTREQKLPVFQQEAAIQSQAMHVAVISLTVTLLRH